MNRREMILGICGAGIAPALSRSKPEPIELGGGSCKGPAEIAEFVANWQLAYARQQCPTDWRERFLSGAIQWREGVAVLFEVGRPDHVADELEWWLNEGLRHPALASYLTPCRRAWAIALQWEMSKAERRAFVEFAEPTLYAEIV